MINHVYLCEVWVVGCLAPHFEKVFKHAINKFVIFPVGLNACTQRLAALMLLCCGYNECALTVSLNLLSPF